MNDLVVSINKNTLKVTAIINNNLISLSTGLPSDVVHDSKITDAGKLSEAIDSLLAEDIKFSRKKLTLTFVVEPQDIHLSFVTVNKNGTDFEEQIVTDLKNKLGDTVLENMYFSYEKIAPFVYQVIAIEKQQLETYFLISNTLKISLKSVLPWVLLIPKYVNTNDSSIFISKSEDDQVVALSDLGGIYFTGVYQNEKSTEELQKLVQDLSVYKRSKPIDIIYTLNYESFSLANGYNVRHVDVPNLGEVQPGFEINILTNYMLDFSQDMLSSHFNLLNLIPLPVVEKKNVSLVQIGSGLGAVVLVGLLFGGFMYLRNSGNPPSETAGEATSVLSSVDEPEQTTASSENEKSSEEPAPELKKEELKVRVENGSGINGIAARTQTLLEKLGYVVPEIDTAAQNEDTTVLRFKPDKVQYKDLLLEDMKESYPDIKVAENLEETAEYDLLIIVGTNVALE
jgi:hypothetical protein